MWRPPEGRGPATGQDGRANRHIEALDGAQPEIYALQELVSSATTEVRR